MDLQSVLVLAGEFYHADCKLQPALIENSTKKSPPIEVGTGVSKLLIENWLKFSSHLLSVNLNGMRQLQNQKQSYQLF